jgi:hypothetical protein
MRKLNTNKLLVAAVAGLALTTGVSFVRQMINPASARADVYGSDMVADWCGEECNSGGGGYASSCGAGEAGADWYCGPVCPPTSNTFDVCFSICAGELCNAVNTTDECVGSNESAQCYGDAMSQAYAVQQFCSAMC